MRSFLLKLAAITLAVVIPVGAIADEADDKAIARQIAENMKNSGKMAGYKIGVAFKEGTAWLNGQVTDRGQQAAAIEIARNTQGVRNVIDRLAIESASPAAPNRPEPAVQDAPRRAAVSARNPEIDIRLAATAATFPREQPQPLAARQIAAPVGRSMQSAGLAPTGRMQAGNTPVAYAGMAVQQAGYGQMAPAFVPSQGRVAPASYDHANMPNYSWPSYAAYPNYAALTYPKQYSPTAWPYIGPFYPYPQVPLGWRKVTLEWDDGWWMLDFHEK